MEKILNLEVKTGQLNIVCVSLLIPFPVALSTLFIPPPFLLLPPPPPPHHQSITECLINFFPIHGFCLSFLSYW